MATGHVRVRAITEVSSIKQQTLHNFFSFGVQSEYSIHVWYVWYINHIYNSMEVMHVCIVQGTEGQVAGGHGQQGE